MLRITDPPGGSTCAGNQVVTATMLNPAMASTVLFKINGETFATVTPGLTMTAELHTLSLGLPDGPATIVVESTLNVYTASQGVVINNPRSLYVEDARGAAGSYVTAHVKLNDFATAAGYHVVLNYDTSELLLDAGSVAQGAGVPISSEFTPNTAVQGVLEATVTGTNTFTSGDMLTASFQIRHPSPSGSITDITMPTAALTNASGGSMTVVGVAGSVITN